jgi:outer membrane protein OmpA-like peptidoglycan-associated protein
LADKAKQFYFKGMFMNTVIKSVFISSIFIATLQQSNADILPPNFGNPPPILGINQAPTPIIWGECIPMPVAPINTPLGNIPYPYSMPIPAPMIAAPNATQYNLPHTSPYFYNQFPSLQRPTETSQETINNVNKQELLSLQDKYKQAATTSKAKIKGLTQALADANNQMLDARTVIETLTQKQELHKAKLEKLESLQINQERNKANLLKELDNTKEKLAEQTNKLKTTNAAHIESDIKFKKQISELESSFNRLKSKYSSAQSIAAEQAKKITNSNQSAAELIALKSAYKSRNVENLALKKRLGDLENAYKTLQAHLSKAKSIAGTQARKLTALGQSTSELSTLKSAYKERNDENVALKNKLAIIKNNTAERLTSCSTKQAAITLKGKQDSETITALKKKLELSEKNNTSLKTQLDTAVKNTASQTRKIASLNQKSAELTAIKSAYKERSNESASLKNKLSGLENENKSLKGQLETAIKNTGSQARKITALSQSAAELEDLKSVYKERSDENTALKSELDKLKNKQNTIDTSHAKFIELQKKCAESETQKQSLQGKIGKLENTLSNQTRKIATLQETTSELDEIKSAYKDLSSTKVESSSQPEAANVDSDSDGVVDANDLCPASAPKVTVNEFGCIPSENITLKGVTFNSGSARLIPSSLPVINAAASTLTQNPNIKIEVAGFTDNQGLAEVNQQLSKRRANSVMIQLIKQGIDAARITVNGYGEKNPVAKNDTEVGRATNRRVEIKIRE